jgi:myo-inositol-1(or 4)-monophosphatase
LSEIEERGKKILLFIPEIMDFLTGIQKKSNFIIEKKGEIDLVTEGDKGSEERLIQFILKNFPNDSILGEEGTSINGTSSYKWIIDPLDGTSNFAHRLPLYAISIGIQNLETSKIDYGLIALPELKEIFHAVRNGGSFKNNKEIHTSQTTKLIDSLCCTGFPYNRNIEIEVLLKNLREVLINTRGIRRTGAAALDLAWVAEGKFDIFYETNLNPWDVAAGSLLVEEAGGRISKFDGSEFDSFYPETLATNKILHSDAVALIRQN